ncbi:MAG: YceD family protein [Coriobacteriales bacterium]|jgi:uncharacterized protein|nr:YceD family protein [Coriobacteriales bacterium]
MQLDPLYIQALPGMRTLGSTQQAQGVLAVSSIDIGHRHFELPEGIAYEANLSNTGEAVLVSGTATAQLATSCDRCLEPAILDITGEIQGYFLLQKPRSERDRGLQEYECVDEKGRIDIAPAVLAAIVFEIPTVALCQPDCDGGSTQAHVAEPLSDAPDTNTPSPFSALKDLL